MIFSFTPDCLIPIYSLVITKLDKPPFELPETGPNFSPKSISSTATQLVTSGCWSNQVLISLTLHCSNSLCVN